jgi:hypothetical protein
MPTYGLPLICSTYAISVRLDYFLAYNHVAFCLHPYPQANAGIGEKTSRGDTSNVGGHAFSEPATELRKRPNVNWDNGRGDRVSIAEPGEYDVEGMMIKI